MVKQVRLWETSDKKRFPTKELAEDHETQLAYTNFVKSFGIEKFPVEDVAGWLMIHTHSIHNFLQEQINGSSTADSGIETAAED